MRLTFIKPGSVSSLVFAISAIAFSRISDALLGQGMWSLLFGFTGVAVAVAPYLPYPPVRRMFQGITGFLGVIALLGVALGLLASTIGGSFRMDDETAMLLGALFVAGVSGIVFSRVDLNPSPPEDNSEAVEDSEHNSQ